MSLRDYVYVDFERVRAYAAQLGEAKGPDPGASGGGGLSVLGAEGAKDMRLIRQEGETQSLKVQAAIGLEDALTQRGAVTAIDGGFAFGEKWNRETLRDGMFVRVTGLVRILDYPWMASLMESLPQMMRVSQRAELNALKQKREAQQATQREVDELVREHQKQLTDLQNWKIDELSEVVRELYGDVVRVKVLPSRENNGAVMVGSARADAFFETPATLAQRYGHDIDASWTVLGQVNLSAPPAAVQAMPMGNAIEDMFERIALAVNNIHRVAGSPAWPTVSVVPLAIYRVVGM